MLDAPLRESTLANRSPSLSMAPPRSAEERTYYALQERAYSTIAPLYDLISFPLSRLRDEVARLADLPPAARVLDVATGTGAQALAFATIASEVVGIDLSPAMLRSARRKNRWSNVRFLEADAAALPFDEGSFDATSISFALHEMPDSIQGRVMREMRRVTRPGGRIVVVDYALPRGAITRFLAYHLIRLYEPREYAAFVHGSVLDPLESAGIQPVGQHAALGGVAGIWFGEVPPPASTRAPICWALLRQDSSLELGRLRAAATDPPAMSFVAEVRRN